MHILEFYGHNPSEDESHQLNTKKHNKTSLSKISAHQNNMIDEINKERSDCLISGYSFRVDLDVGDDVFRLIYDYYNSNDLQIGQFLTREQYFGEGSVHIDSVSCVDHREQWPGYLYQTQKPELFRNILGIIIVVLIEFGFIIGLYYLYFVAPGAFAILFIGTLTFQTIFCKCLYQVGQKIVTPTVVNDILLIKFDFSNNVIQKWRMTVHKLNSFGNLAFDTQYFCQLIGVIKLGYISQIRQIIFCAPWKTTSDQHTEYHDGVIRFTPHTLVQLTYGADCNRIRRSICHILNKAHQPFYFKTIENGKE